MTDRDKWQPVQHLAYIYLAMAGITDRKIDQSESRAIVAQLREWPLDLDADELVRLLPSVRDAFAGDVRAGGFHIVLKQVEQSAKTLRQSFGDADLRRALTDIATVVRANPEAVKYEKKLLGLIARMWRIESAASESGDHPGTITSAGRSTDSASLDAHESLYRANAYLVGKLSSDDDDFRSTTATLMYLGPELYDYLSSSGRTEDLRWLFGVAVEHPEYVLTREIVDLYLTGTISKETFLDVLPYTATAQHPDTSRNYEPKIGEPLELARLILGEPTEVRTATTQRAKTEEWIYRESSRAQNRQIEALLLKFKNGKLTKYEDSRSKTYRATPQHSTWTILRTDLRVAYSRIMAAICDPRVTSSSTVDALSNVVLESSASLNPGFKTCSYDFDRLKLEVDPDSPLVADSCNQDETHVGDRVVSRDSQNQGRIGYVLELDVSADDPHAIVRWSDGSSEFQYLAYLENQSGPHRLVCQALLAGELRELSRQQVRNTEAILAQLQADVESAGELVKQLANGCVRDEYGHFSPVAEAKQEYLDERDVRSYIARLEDAIGRLLEDCTRAKKSLCDLLLLAPQELSDHGVSVADVQGYTSEYERIQAQHRAKIEPKVRQSIELECEAEDLGKTLRKLAELRRSRGKRPLQDNGSPTGCMGTLLIGLAATAAALVGLL